MAGKGITIVIKGDGESAKAALDLVQEQMRRTGAEANSLGTQVADAMEGVNRVLALGGLSIGMEQIVSAMKEMVSSSVELGVEIGHMAQETGISAQNLSVLKYASDATGVSFEALSKGSLKLSKDMLDAEEGKKTAINSFARLGITQDEVRAKSGDLYGMLGLIADKFETIPDGPNKAAAAIGIFGKAGAALIPFLDQGAAGIEQLRGEAQALGLVLDEEGVAKMEAMQHALVQMRGVMEGAALGITSGMEPAVAGLAGVLVGATAGANSLVAAGAKIGEMALGAAYSLNYMIEFVRKAAAEYMSLESHINAAFDSVDAKIGFTEGQRASAAKHLTDDINESNAAILAYKRAGDDYEKTANAIAGISLDGPAAKPSAGAAGGRVVPGDQSGGKKSTDSIARGATALAEAEAQAAADAIRSANTRLLAELEDGHKAQLVSDRDFYLEKLLLQKDSLDAEADAIRAKQADLQGLLERQRNDKLLKRNSNGDSAEELKTQQELVQLAEKLNALSEKRETLDSGYRSGEEVRSEEVKLATLKQAAAVEEETNRTITARLALLREESEQTLKKIGNAAGTDSPEYQQAQQLEKLKEAKLQIGDVNRQITETENDYKRAVEQLNDAAEKDPRLKLAAQQQINQLNQAEAAQLRDLVAQYHALADVLGGEFTEKAKALDAELAKLGTPDRREDAQFGKVFAEGIEGMTRQIADAALTGKESFHSMAKSIEEDLLNLALKMAEQKYLMPLLSGVFGGGGKLPSVGNLGAPSLGAPSSPGGSGGGGATGIFGSVLGAIGLGGGGGASGNAPNVQIVLTNTTSTPVTASTTGQSWDADAKQFVVHAVLEDASSGGPLSQLFQGINV